MKHRHFPRYIDDADFTTNAPSYYEDLARKEKLIRLLAERIWGYEKILDETLEEIQERFRAWDKNLEDFPDDVKVLLQKWLDDGTLDHIINDTIFNWKLDTVIFEQFRDSITAQLQQTVKKSTFEQFEVSTNQQLAQTAKYIIPENFGATGDGVTDDTSALQNCIDFALNNNIQHVLLESEYLINGTLFVDKNQGARDTFMFSGKGKLIKNNAGYLFDSNISGGNIRFKDFSIKSVSGVGTKVFNNSRLIRLYFTGIDFLNVDHLFLNTEDGQRDFAQTIYLNDCTVTGGEGWFMESAGAYDISFSHSICEHRDSFAYIRIADSFRIIDSLIEGLTGQIYKGRYGKQVTISDNYFEKVAAGLDGTSTLLPYIEFTDTTLTEGSSITIQSNLFAGSTNQIASDTYYPVSFALAYDSYIIGGNWSNMNLYKVQNINTVTPHFLVKVQEEHLASANKFVVNQYKPTRIYYGGKNLIPKFERPFATTGAGLPYTGTDLKLIGGTVGSIGTTIDRSLTLKTNDDTGVRLGIELIEQFLLFKNTNYVFGFKGSTRNFGTTKPSVRISVLNASTGNVVYNHNLKIQESTVLRPQLYSLPSFTVETTGNYVLQVDMQQNGEPIKPTSGVNELVIEKIILQEGTIAV